jgi:hypothetical protein
MSWLTLGKAESAHFLDAIKEIETGPDRTVAVVAGSFVEIHLQTAIEAWLVRHDKITPEMFRISGPLGTFGAKINLGFMIGLYTEKPHRELDTIKDIRNAFAHKLEVNSFDNPRMKALAGNLILADKTKVYISAPGGAFGVGAKLTLTIGSKPEEDKFTPLLPQIEKPSPRQRYVRACQLFLALLAVAPHLRPPHPSSIF